MSIMLVGADHLGNIERNLQTLGIHTINHITGRNVLQGKRFKFPLSTTLVIIFIDYINHATAKNIKQMAKSQGVPLVFANRSWSSLQDKLITFDLRQLG